VTAGVYLALKDLTRLRHGAHGLGFLPMQPTHSVLAGRKRARLRGRGLDFSELRRYRPGDDIRAMDWRVTRRTGNPHVRIYAEERDRPVWLLIDQRLSMFFGSRHQMKSVAAGSAAALAAWGVLAVGDRVGALLFNDQQQRLTPPSRSHTTTLGWLAQLVTMNNQLTAGRGQPSNAAGLAQALQALAPRLGHNGLVIIISDFDGWGDDCLKTLKAIRRNNDIIATVISDPMERDIVTAHKLVASDGQHQLEIDAQRSSTATRFRADFQQRFGQLSATLKRHGIPVIPLSTESDITLQLHRQLGASLTDRR